MIRSVDRHLVRLVLVGAMALALAGCGRKSGLDAPPSTKLAPAPSARQPSLGEPADPYGRGAEPAAQPTIAGEVPKKDPFVLDWLLR